MKVKSTMKKIIVIILLALMFAGCTNVITPESYYVYNFYLDNKIIWTEKESEVDLNDFINIGLYFDYSYNAKASWYYNEWLLGNKAWFIDGKHLVIVKEIFE